MKQPNSTRGINRDIRRYMTTSVAAVFVTTVLGIVDSLISGRMIGESALMATGLSGPIFLISNMLSAMLSGGGGIAAAHALGAGDRELASKIICVTFSLAIAIVLAAGIPLFIFADGIASFLGAPDEAVAITSDYVAGSSFALAGMTLAQGSFPTACSITTRAQNTCLLRTQSHFSAP